MKFYIATTLSNAETAKKLRDALCDAGHELTYDWMAHGPVLHLGMDMMREICAREIKGVMDAEAVIVVFPGARGTHTELGIAIGSNIPVLIFSDKAAAEEDWSCTFYHARNCERARFANKPSMIDIVDAAREWLDSLSRNQTKRSER